jgi:hypothetical protein
MCRLFFTIFLGYICKNIQKVTTTNDCLDSDNILSFSSYNKDLCQYLPFHLFTVFIIIALHALLC